MALLHFSDQSLARTKLHIFVTRLALIITLWVGLGLIGLGLGAAQARGTPDGFADLVEELSPSVVNISTSKNVGGFGDSENMEPFRRNLGQQAIAMGSGFIISRDGFVVTNNHVIDEADSIKVTLSDGTEYSASIVGVDRETDIAVLKIEDATEKLPFVSWGDSINARVGDWVVAIGNPFGLGGSVSAGIISARNRDIDSGTYDDYIQTDAAINRGNSGGPLFNMKGEVIGMNTAIFSQTGGSVGVGFAIPADLAQPVVSQLITYGETHRGWLGVTLGELTQTRAKELGLDSPNGALVLSVRSSSPALRAGFRADDVVILFNGRVIKNSRDLTRAVADTPVGKTVNAKIMRGGKQMVLRVTVDRREKALRQLSSLNPSTNLPAGAATTSGLTLQEPTPEVRRLYGLAEDTKGIVVTAIDPSSPAARVLQIGDVILEIGWNKISNPFDAVDKFEQLRALNSGPIQIYVQRGDSLFYELIKP